MKSKNIEVGYRWGVLNKHNAPEWRSDLKKNLITDWGITNLSNCWFAAMTENVILGTDSTPNRVPVIATHSGTTVEITTPVFTVANAVGNHGILMESGLYLEITQYVSPTKVVVDYEVSENSSQEPAVLCITDHDTLDGVLIGNTYEESGCKNTIEKVTENGEDYLIIGNSRGVSFSSASNLAGLTTTNGTLNQDMKFSEIGWSPIAGSKSAKVFGRRIEDLYFMAGERPYVEVTIYRKVPVSVVQNGTVGVAESLESNSIGMYKASSQFMFDAICDGDYSESSALWNFASKVDPTTGETIAPAYPETLLEGIGGGRRYFVAANASFNPTQHLLTYDSGTMAMCTAPIETQHGYVQKQLHTASENYPSIDSFTNLGGTAVHRVIDNGNIYSWYKDSDGNWAANPSVSVLGSYGATYSVDLGIDKLTKNGRYAYYKDSLDHLVTLRFDTEVPEVVSETEWVLYEDPDDVFKVISRQDGELIKRYIGASAPENETLALPTDYTHVTTLANGGMAILINGVWYQINTPDLEIPAAISGTGVTWANLLSVEGVTTSATYKVHGDTVYGFADAKVYVYDFVGEPSVISRTIGHSALDAQAFNNRLAVLIPDTQDAGSDIVTIYKGTNYETAVESFRVTKQTTFGNTIDNSIMVVGLGIFTTYTEKHTYGNGAIVDSLDTLNLNDIHEYLTGTKAMTTRDAHASANTEYTFMRVQDPDNDTDIRKICLVLQLPGTGVAPDTPPQYAIMYMTTLTKVDGDTGIVSEGNTIENFGIATYWTRLNGYALGIDKPVWKEWAGYSGRNAIPNVTASDIGYAGGCSWNFDRAKVPTVFELPTISTGYEVCAVMKVASSAHIAVKAATGNVIMGSGGNVYESTDIDENYACIVLRGLSDGTWVVVNAIGSWDPALVPDDDIFNAAPTIQASTFQHESSGSDGGSLGYSATKVHISDTKVTIGMDAKTWTDSTYRDKNFIDSTSTFSSLPTYPTGGGVNTVKLWSSDVGDISKGSDILPLIVPDDARRTSIRIEQRTTQSDDTANAAYFEIDIDWESTKIIGTGFWQRGTASGTHTFQGVTTSKSVHSSGPTQITERTFVPVYKLSLDGRKLTALPWDRSFPFGTVLITHYEAAEYTARPTVETNTIVASGPAANINGYLDKVTPMWASQTRVVDGQSVAISDLNDPTGLLEVLPDFYCSKTGTIVSLTTQSEYQPDKTPWNADVYEHGVLPHKSDVLVDHTVVRVKGHMVDDDRLELESDDIKTERIGSFEYTMRINWSSGDCTIEGTRSVEGRVVDSFVYSWNWKTTPTAVFTPSNLGMGVGGNLCNLSSMSTVIGDRVIERLPMWRDDGDDLMYKVNVGIEDSKTVSATGSSSSNGNVDYASIFSGGVIEIATPRETISVERDDLAVTPASLKALMVATQNSYFEYRQGSTRDLYSPSEFAGVSATGHFSSTGDLETNGFRHGKLAAMFTMWVYVREDITKSFTPRYIDDCYRVHIDGQLVANVRHVEWGNYQVPVELTAGFHRMDIVINNDGGSERYCEVYANYVDYNTVFPLREYQYTNWTADELDDAFEGGLV